MEKNALTKSIVAPSTPEAVMIGFSRDSISYRAAVIEATNLVMCAVVHSHMCMSYAKTNKNKNIKPQYEENVVDS